MEEKKANKNHSNYYYECYQCGEDDINILMRINCDVFTYTKEQIICSYCLYIDATNYADTKYSDEEDLGNEYRKEIKKDYYIDIYTTLTTIKDIKK